MPRNRRGLQQVRTMAGLVDVRRSRTSPGALLELSMLEMEKTRLEAEIRRAEQRCAEIRVRLNAIAAKKKRLHAFVENPQVNAELPAAAPLPVHKAPDARLKRHRFSY